MRIVTFAFFFIITGIFLIANPVDSACGGSGGNFIELIPVNYQSSGSSLSMNPFGGASGQSSGYGLSLSGQQGLEDANQFLTTSSIPTPQGTSLFDIGTNDLNVGKSSSLVDFQKRTPIINATIKPNVTLKSTASPKPSQTSLFDLGSIDPSVSKSSSLVDFQKGPNSIANVNIPPLEAGIGGNTTLKITANATSAKNTTVTIKKNVTTIKTTIKATITKKV